jgi:16S rRNA (uracil1498-N3)-methyltransferase
MTDRPDDGHDFRAQRLYVEHDLGAGAFLPLTREQANYLLNVLRLGPGAGIRVFNGRDGEWLANVVPTGRRDAQLEVRRQLREQSGGPDIDYLFAPLKRARLDYMVQKATELGVARLRPVMTQFTNAERINLERMRANAVEAAEQCGILAIPEVRDAQRFTPLLAGWDKERRLIFCDESAETNNPLPALKAIHERKLGLLVGPEGGFSEDERRQLRALPFVTAIPLGPRILRADTAAVAALAVIQATVGDW